MSNPSSQPVCPTYGCGSLGKVVNLSKSQSSPVKWGYDWFTRREVNVLMGNGTRIKRVKLCRLFRTEPGTWSVLNTYCLLLLFLLLMNAFSTNVLPVLFSRRGIASISGLWLYRLMNLTSSSADSFLQGAPSNMDSSREQVAIQDWVTQWKIQGRVPTALPGKLTGRDSFVFIEERPVGPSKESGLLRDFRKELF